jgi:cell division septation protein DedD
LELLGRTVFVFGVGTMLSLACSAASAQAFSAAEQRAITASGLPRTSVVSVKSDMVVAIRSRGALSQGGGVVEGVVLQGEVVSAQAAQFVGYRSMRSTVNIDCGRRRDMVVKMTVFTEPAAKGVAINRHVPGGWVQPSPDAYLSDVIRAVCSALPRQAATPEVKPIEPEPQLRTTAAAPDADGPLRTSLDARAGRAPVPSKTPLAEDAPAPVAPPVQKASAPSPKAAPAASPPRPRAPGKVAVQIAAASSDAQARQALAKLRGRIVAPLSPDVRTVVVDGKTFHRALITGFQTRSEAQAFCAAMKGDCFIR